MKVAIACSGLGNVKRGYETFAEDLFNHLKGEIDVTLFKGGRVSSKNEKVLPNIKRNSILLGREKSPLDWEKRYLIEQFTFSVPLAYELFKGKYDIVHFSDPQIGNNIYHLGKIWKRVPKLLFSNGGPTSPGHYMRFDHVQQLTPFYLEKGIEGGYSSQHMSLVPYGIDTKKFGQKTESNFRRTYNIPENVFLVLSVGTINKKHKRMHWIINEVAKLKEKPYLMIIGEEDKESNEIKKLGMDLLGSNIRFLKLERDELPQAYAASDIFVSASLIEGFGIVFLESMSMGLPTIAHDHQNQKWVLGDAGLFVNMEKENELASKIEYLIENNREARRIGKQGQKRVDKIFSWDVLIPKYLEMYKKILE
jgi:glycosyltransferase involved in cell wall biosynthesis